MAWVGSCFESGIKWLVISVECTNWTLGFSSFLAKFFQSGVYAEKGSCGTWGKISPKMTKFWQQLSNTHLTLFLAYCAELNRSINLSKKVGLFSERLFEYLPFLNYDFPTELWRSILQVFYPQMMNWSHHQRISCAKIKVHQSIVDKIKKNCDNCELHPFSTSTRV